MHDSPDTPEASSSAPPTEPALSAAAPPKGVRRSRKVWGGPLVRALARDKLLLALTVLLTGLNLWPLTQAYYLPLTDVPHHAAYATLLDGLLSGDPVASHFFKLQSNPSPYWTLYLLLLGVGKVTGPVLATHWVAGLAVVLLPLALMRLLVAVGRSPRYGLIGFLLAWDLNIHMGFLAFSLGVSLTLIYVARVLELLRSARPLQAKGSQATLLLGACIAWTHAHAALTAAAVLGALALAEPGRPGAVRRRIGVLLGAALVPFASLLPWLASAPGMKNNAPPTWVQLGQWPPLGARLQGLIHHAGGIPTGLVESEIQGLVLWFLLFVPLLLLALGRGAPRALRRGVALYLLGWALVTLLPAQFFWPFHQVFIYERHVPMMLAFGALLPGSRSQRHTQFVVGPVVVLALALAWQNVRYFSAFERETGPLRDIIAAIPPKKTVLPVVWVFRPEESTLETVFAVTAYYTAEKGGYTPHLFATPNLPVVPREDTALLTPVWKVPAQTNVPQHAFRYDYVIVQGKDRDRFRERTYNTVEGGMVRLERVLEKGMFRLYRVLPMPVTPAPDSAQRSP